MRSIRVLLIDDDPDACMFMHRAFTRADANCEVHTLPDGEQAIAYLSEGLRGSPIVLPSVLITDLNMPRRNGFEVLAWMRTQPALSAVPAYVLTSSREPSDIERATALGARACFEKPLRWSELAGIARSIVAGRTELQPEVPS